MSVWSKKRRVMRRYDSTAHMYDGRYAEEQEAKFEVALKALNLSCYALVLDAGCGTGLFFGHVASHADTTIGLDFSRKILLQAKERAKNFSNVHVILADADRIPFKEASFDIVFAFTLLQNMPNPDETLKEIGRAAKHGALLVITGLKKAFPLETFEKLLRDSGLRIISLHDNALKCYVAICRI